MTFYDYAWAVSQKHPILGALLMFPGRTAQALTDPVRRRHVITRVGEGYVGGQLAQFVIVWIVFDFLYNFKFMFHHPFLYFLGPFLVPLFEFIVYEFILEPVTGKKRPSWCGPYWERGPRDGERFVNE